MGAIDMRVLALLILLIIGAATVLSLVELYRIRCHTYGIADLSGRLDSVEGDVEILMLINKDKGKQGRKDYFEIIKLKRDNGKLKAENERLKKQRAGTAAGSNRLESVSSPSDAEVAH